MRKAVIAFVALAIVAGWAGTALAQQNGEDAKFQKFLDGFWDAYFKFFPTAGTIAGFGKYGERLEDLGTGAVDKFHDGLDVFNQELVAKIDRTKLSPDLQIDHEMMVDFLDGIYIDFEMLVPWEYNPLYYNEIFANTLTALLVKNGTPLDARVKSATERAKLLLGLIKKAKENLKTPPRIYVEAALAQLPAIASLYRVDIPGLANGAAGQALLSAETAKVAAALDEYRTFLQNDLLPKSTDNFRVGDAHPRLLRNKTQGTLAINEEVVARSKADVTNIRRAMGLVCLPFFKIMYPKVNADQIVAQRGEEAGLNVVIQGVLDKIKVDAPTRENYIAKIGEAAASLKAFIAENQLIDLPEAELKIETTPAQARGVAWSRLIGPGPFEPSGPFTLWIQPVPDDWTSEQVAQYLSEQNHLFLDFLTVQKVYPGRFVPTALSRPAASIVRRVAANQALLKAWPLGLAETLILSGYGSYDLRMRLFQLKLFLKNAIDFQMDINIHQGSSTKDQVVKYMTQFGFMTQAEAERRFTEIVLNPGEAAATYVGYQEILDMEKDYKALKGESFSQKEFLGKLLSYGPIPLRLLKAKMAQ
jgi:uncharacterized protein (DUF885 family)